MIVKGKYRQNGQAPHQEVSELAIQEKLKQQRQVRAQKCYNEIAVILKKYNCIINPMFTLTMQGAKGSIHIEAK